MNKLKNLDEFNHEKVTAHRNRYKPHTNGIKCPNCESELWDSSPMEILASDPPRKHIHCPTCRYKGYRFV